MAIIHQILYESSDFSHVDFSSVIHSLVSNLSVSYASDSSRIQINTDTDHIHISIDTSIPLGLILNELCINAMKYAFIGKSSGKIDISLKYQGVDKFQMLITDNGIGIPEELDIENTSSLGLQLVQLLSEQISAELIIHRKNPTSFSFTIPLAVETHSETTEKLPGS